MLEVTPELAVHTRVPRGGHLLPRCMAPATLRYLKGLKLLAWAVACASSWRTWEVCPHGHNEATSRKISAYSSGAQAELWEGGMGDPGGEQLPSQIHQDLGC